MLLQLAGWSGLTDRLVRDPVSRAILSKKGFAVAVSAVAGPLGTGFGVYTMSGSTGAGAIAAAAVLVMVLVADRDYIFASDTQTRVPWIGQFRLWLLLMLAFPTAFSIWITWNHSHLQVIAADVRIERATARQTSMDGATGLNAARTIDSSATEKLEGLRQQRLTLPADIAAKKSAAMQCSASVDRRLDALLRQGVEGRDAQTAVNDARRRCAMNARNAAIAEEQYFAGIDADVAQARELADRTASALSAAVKAKHALLDVAAVIDAASVNPTSLAVGFRYLQENGLAVVELVAIYVVVVVCDGAGLLMATILGRSPAGCRFERDRVQVSAPLVTETANAHLEIVLAEGLMRQATVAARADDAATHIRAELAGVQTAIATESANALSHAAPWLAAAPSINAMVAASIEANDAARRAHEIDPALGRTADAVLARATKGAKGEVVV